MSFAADSVLDAPLNAIRAANRLDLCSAQPTTYLEATSTLSLGNKTGVVIGAPADRLGGGRQVVVPALTGGTVLANGSPTHWALSDTVTSALLATGPVISGATLTTGTPFEVPQFVLAAPDPVAV